MAPPPAAPESQPQTANTKQSLLPDGVEKVMATSLQVGAATGALGMLWGAGTGIVVASRVPVLFTIVSGLQWFAQGSIYYGSKHVILSRHGPVDTSTPVQKLEASTLGGIISAVTVVGLMRGRSSLLPAAVVGSLLGGGGQFAVNSWTASRETEKKSDSFSISKWLPMKKLTDQEYENVLEEKLLKLDAEIAIIDQNIAALRAQKEEQTRATTQPPRTPNQQGTSLN